MLPLAATTIEPQVGAKVGSQLDGFFTLVPRLFFKAPANTGVSSAGTTEITCSGRNTTLLPNQNGIPVGTLLSFPT
jgi:hypothetical protein